MSEMSLLNYGEDVCKDKRACLGFCVRLSYDSMIRSLGSIPDRGTQFSQIAFRTAFRALLWYVVLDYRDSNPHDIFIWYTTVS